MDIKLPVYQSLCGTSKCESMHIVIARKSVLWNNFSLALFDAKTLWLITNYNQQRLLDLGTSIVLPFSVLPAEAPNTILLADETTNHHIIE